MDRDGLRSLDIALDSIWRTRSAVFGDPLKVDALAGSQHCAAVSELLLGEQARLDSFGQLDLLLGVQQRYFADLREVVLDRVSSRAGGCHPGGGKALVVIAGNPRLVLALLARCRRRAASSSRNIALAGAGLLLTCRLLRSAGLILGSA